VAKRDGTTDDSSAFKAAVDSVMSHTTGGSVYLSAGKYRLNSNLTINNGGTKGFVLMGEGEYNTILYFNSAISGDLITWKCTGPNTSIHDLMITTDSTGSLGTTRGLNIVSSNGVNAYNLWISSCQRGLYVSDNSSNNAFSRIHTELNFFNISISASDANTFSDIHSYRSSSCGIHITGTPTLAIAGTYQGNVFNNISLLEDGYGGDGAGAGFYNESPVPYAINNITIGGYGGTQFPFTGIYNYTGHTYGTVNNPLIMMASRYGIRHLAGNLYINGGKIDKTGYYDQTVPWATNGIFAGPSAISLKVKGMWINSEGNGVHTQAIWTELDGLTLFNCSSGGSTGSVNATTGLYSILFDPQTTEHRFILTNSHFYTSGGTGKTALRFNATATPAYYGSVKVANNSASYDSADFDARFSSAIDNAHLILYDWSNNKSLVVTENSGSSVIANTTTYTDVNHGLSITPSAEHITIIGKENPTNSVGAIWISDIGSSTFRVNVENDPGASNWDFGWKAIIK